MGIAGLLPLVERAMRDVDVGVLRGKRVAVDGYCWLHRGAHACAEDLCLGRPTTRYLGYVAAMLDVLARAGATPTVVLDGGALPAKAGQEAHRAARRARGAAEARAALARGDAQGARTACCRAVDVTPAMAARCMQLLRARGVAFVVAPFEADAQLAFLARSGAADVVVTEDSDMLPYGVPATLYKLDRRGSARLLLLADVLRLSPFHGFSLTVCPLSFSLSFLTRSHTFLSHMFTHTQQLRETCVLAGCDYLEGLAGVGLRTALRLLRRHGDARRAVRACRLAGAAVPADYERRFAEAMLTFDHQQVFDPAADAPRPLTPVPAGTVWATDYAPFLGPFVMLPHAVHHHHLSCAHTLWCCAVWGTARSTPSSRARSRTAQWTRSRASRTRQSCSARSRPCLCRRQQRRHCAPGRRARTTSRSSLPLQMPRHLLHQRSQRQRRGQRQGRQSRSRLWPQTRTRPCAGASTMSC